MVGCAAFGCKSYSQKKEPKVTFHRFPKDPEKRKLWIKNMKITNWEPTRNDRICSKHFEKRYFYQTNSQERLLHGAIPRIFEELPKHLQPKMVKERPRRDTPEQRPSSLEVKEDLEIQKLRRKLFRVVARSREKTRKIRVLTQSLKRARQRNSEPEVLIIIKEVEKQHQL